MIAASIRKRLEKLERTVMKTDRIVSIDGRDFAVGFVFIGLKGSPRFLIRYDELARKVEYQTYVKGVKASKTCTPAAWVKWVGEA